jgi:23S rRNA maturation mini-RNase III
VSGLSAELIAEAWIGDAVLTLYIRSLILREEGQINGERCARLTSNQFLAARGEPTRVEAEIGRVYQSQGLEAAFSWIESNLLPLLLKQEENRLRKGR